MIVCNTTPLSNFLHLGQMAILGRIFGQLHVPSAVRHELDATFADDAEWQRCLRDGVVVVEAVRDALLVKQFMATLHAGEAEALCLALEMNAGLCLIDDRDARDVATANGLKVCGTVGVLIQAKRVGLIQTVQKPMDFLRSRHHFWVGDDLYCRALLLAQEESI